MKTLGGILIGFVIVGLLAIPALIAYNTDEFVTFTVEEKERITSRDNTDSKYLIFTDKGVYQNTDTIWYFKFNSSDVYGELKAGETYDAHVYGFRVPFFSWYKNIISVEPTE